MDKPKSPKIKRTLLVDFDIVLFKFAYTNEFEIDWKDGSPKVTCTRPEKAKYSIWRFIEKMRKRCRCTDVTLFVTGSFNFRYEVLPSYKHNRVDVVKPSLMGELKLWAMEEYEVIQEKGLEADDLMGVYGSRDKRNTVVATIDKDLKQIPCKLYLWNRDTLTSINIKDADTWFYRQILTGDSTDGYTGCPGVGPMKADGLLLNNPKRNWWKAVVDVYQETLASAYVLEDKECAGEKVPKKNWWADFISKCEEAGGAKAYALQQARVARILRNEDYDPVTKKPILWTPKGHKEVSVDDGSG